MKMECRKHGEYFFIEDFKCPKCVEEAVADRIKMKDYQFTIEGKDVEFSSLSDEELKKHEPMPVINPEYKTVDIEATIMRDSQQAMQDWFDAEILKPTEPWKVPSIEVHEKEYVHELIRVLLNQKTKTIESGDIVYDIRFDSEVTYIWLKCGRSGGMISDQDVADMHALEKIDFMFKMPIEVGHELETKTRTEAFCTPSDARGLQREARSRAKARDSED